MFPNQHQLEQNLQGPFDQGQLTELFSLARPC